MTWQLTTPTETMSLHAQFVWADEFDWTPLAQSEPVYTLTGAVDIQQGTKKAGRPITLNGDNVWLTRRQLKQLQAWASIPELVMTLRHPKGQSFEVIFAKVAIDNITAIKQHRPFDDLDDDKYRFNLHFLTV